MNRIEKIIEKIYIAGGLVLLMVVIMAMSSCEKGESFKVRNYSYPGDLENPTGIPQLAAGIHVYPGESDDYWVKESQVGPGAAPSDDVVNPDPRYMLFPHSINSISDEWGWEYLEEYKELGEQAFCDKYLNGERTLGMKLKSI